MSGQAQTFDGTPAWTRLKNKRPDRVYRMINKSGGEANQVPRYLEMGYEVERWGDPNDPNRLKFGAGVTGIKGEQMEYSGHVVMSMDRATWEEIERNGDGQGGLGQSYADRLEKQLGRGVGVSNPLRGREGIFGHRLQLGRSMSSDGQYEEIDSGEE